MIYLKGITKAHKETSRKKTKRFNKLKIPFKNEEELESFRFNRERQFNKNIYFMSIEKNKQMDEAIKVLQEFGIKRTEEELKKWNDIPSNIKAKEVIEGEQKKMDEYKHAIEILSLINDFFESFNKIMSDD